MSNTLTTSIDTKQHYTTIDVFKLIAAILVVLIHCSDNPDDYTATCLTFTISRFAVPYFLIVSGFFFKKGLDKTDNKNTYFLNHIKKLSLLYLFWSLVTLPSTVLTYLELYPDSSFLYISVLIFRRIFLAGTGGYWYILATLEASIVIFLLINSN